MRTRRLAIALLILGLILLGSILPGLWLISGMTEGRAGLSIKTPVVLGAGTSVSFTQLASLRFTDVGTDVDLELLENSSARGLLRDWISDAHRNGLRTFAQIGTNLGALKVAELALETGFDYLEFDELMSKGEINYAGFHSMIHDLHRGHSVEIILTEFQPTALGMAASLAREHPGIIVFSDNYQEISSLEDVKRMGQTFQIEVGTWLIFIPDPPRVWRAHVDLEAWIREALRLGLNVYFFAIDKDGTWQEKWPLIRGILTERQSFIINVELAVFAVWVIAPILTLTLYWKVHRRKKSRRAGLKFCSWCGRQLEDYARFCDKCGVRAQPLQPLENWRDSK